MNQTRHGDGDLMNRQLDTPRSAPYDRLRDIWGSCCVHPYLRWSRLSQWFGDGAEESGMKQVAAGAVFLAAVGGVAGCSSSGAGSSGTSTSSGTSSVSKSTAGSASTSPAVPSPPSSTSSTAAAPVVPAGFTLKVFAAPGTLKGPDDITMAGGNVYIAYQNGVGSKGEAAKTARDHRNGAQVLTNRQKARVVVAKRQDRRTRFQPDRHGRRDRKRGRQLQPLHDHRDHAEALHLPAHQTGPRRRYRRGHVPERANARDCISSRWWSNGANSSPGPRCTT